MAIRSTRSSCAGSGTTWSACREWRPAGWPGASSTSGGDEREPVRPEDLVHRLEPGLAAGGAVAPPAGGHALGLLTGDVRAAGVTRLGTHVRVRHLVDGALLVVHRLVHAEHGAAVPVRRG